MVVARNCPEMEDLAAFIDGTLTDPDSDGIRKHLVECGDCYAVFSGSVRFLQQGTAAAPVLTHRRFGRQKVAYAVAASLAAAAAVLLMARTPALDYLTNWINPTEPASLTWAIDERMEPLGQRGNFRSLSDAAWDPSENILTFAGGLSPEKTAFQLGVQLVDLEVSLRGNQARAASGALDRLSSLVAPLESSGSIAAWLEQGQDELGAGTAPRQLSGLSSRIEGAAQAVVDETYFSLGKWAEAGRLAAVSRNATYFDEPRHKEYVQALQQLTLPPELTKELRTIELLLQEQEVDLDGLEQALTQIILLH